MSEGKRTLETVAEVCRIISLPMYGALVGLNLVNGEVLLAVIWGVALLLTLASSISNAITKATAPQAGGGQ